MTVGELEQRMTSAELAEWMAFSNIEPLLLARMDYQAALFSCVAGNQFREKPLQLRDCMPVWEDNTADGVHTIQDDAFQFVVALGGTVPARKAQKKAGRSKRAQKPKEEAAPAKERGIHLRDPRNRPK